VGELGRETKTWFAEKKKETSVLFIQGCPHKRAELDGGGATGVCWDGEKSSSPQRRNDWYNHAGKKCQGSAVLPAKESRRLGLSLLNRDLFQSHKGGLSFVRKLLAEGESQPVNGEIWMFGLLGAALHRNVGFTILLSKVESLLIGKPRTQHRGGGNITGEGGTRIFLKSAYYKVG